MSLWNIEKFERVAPMEKDLKNISNNSTNIEASSNLKRVQPKLLYILVAAVVCVVAALAVLKPWSSSSTQVNSIPMSVKMPANPAIEDKWGIRISQIGVTADGGLVDFRFVVIDPQKAANMMQDEKNLPVLIPTGSSKIVNSASLMTAKHDLNPGQTYFLLYRNTGGAIKHNSYVNVVFDEKLQLESAIVR